MSRFPAQPDPPPDDGSGGENEGGDGVNEPPQLVEPVGDRIVVAGGGGESIDLAPRWSDPESGAVSFALQGSPPAFMRVVGTSLAITPTSGQAPGQYPVTIVATDDGTPPASATESITVEVVPAVRAVTRPTTVWQAAVWRLKQWPARIWGR